MYASLHMASMCAVALEAGIRTMARTPGKDHESATQLRCSEMDTPRLGRASVSAAECVSLSSCLSRALYADFEKNVTP